jgi:hypothetical protein
MQPDARDERGFHLLRWIERFLEKNSDGDTVPSYLVVKEEAIRVWGPEAFDNEKTATKAILAGADSADAAPAGSTARRALQWSMAEEDAPESGSIQAGESGSIPARESDTIPAEAAAT